MEKQKREINDFDYVVFVIGSDLMQKELFKNDSNMDIDDIYEKCVELANEYFESEFEQQDKSLYECLQEFCYMKLNQIPIETIAYDLINNGFITAGSFLSKDFPFIKLSINTISQILQDNGFEDASKYLDCKYEL